MTVMIVAHVIVVLVTRVNSQVLDGLVGGSLLSPAGASSSAAHVLAN